MGVVSLKTALRKRWRILLVSGLLTALALASFLVVRSLTSDDEASAGPNDPESLGFVEALQEDAKKPRLEQQVLNGILVGPDPKLVPTNPICERKDVVTEYVPFDKLNAASDSSPARIQPRLPTGVVLTGGEGSRCDGTLVIAAKYYEVPAKYDPNDSRSLVWAGGSFSISRRLTEQDKFPLLGAADRAISLEIGGHSAAAMEPVKPKGVDIGLDRMTIVIADESGITTIDGSGLPFADFIAIAESLYEASS